MNLSAFLKQRSANNDLLQITAPVASALEIAAISRREFAKGNAGKVLRFEHPVPGNFPIVTNLFGSEARMSAILRTTSLADFERQIEAYLNKNSRLAGETEQVTGSATRTDHELAHLSEECLLSTLPALLSWPEEIKPYLTLALAITADPENGKQNLGLYRVQIIDDDTLAINLSAYSGGNKHLQKAAELGGKLPICLVLGCDPLLMWAAAAPLPAENDDLTFCREFFAEDFLQGTIPDTSLRLPVTSELVICGEITPGVVGSEGPFGNHTGVYVTRDDCPLVKVTSIRHRPKAILPFTVVGPPPSENVWLAASNEILIRQLLKTEYSEITNLVMPVTTIFHGVSIISVGDLTAGQVRQLVDSLWHRSLLQYAPLIIIVDDDINPRHLENCWWRVINQLNGVRVYQDRRRIAIDATGVDRASLVKEGLLTAELIQTRQKEPGYYPCEL